MVQNCNIIGMITNGVRKGVEVREPEKFMVRAINKLEFFNLLLIRMMDSCGEMRHEMQQSVSFFDHILQPDYERKTKWMWNDSKFNR